MSRELIHLWAGVGGKSSLSFRLVGLASAWEVPSFQAPGCVWWHSLCKAVELKKRWVKSGAPKGLSVLLKEPVLAGAPLRSPLL